jgi:hypothetical protein
MKVVREGKGKMDLLPESGPIQDIIDSVVQIAAETDIASLSPHEYGQLCLGAALQKSQSFKYIAMNHENFWYDYCEKFEQVLFWTCYKEMGEDIFLDEDIYAELLNQNSDLSCSVLQLWRHFLTRDEVQWNEAKIKRINLFIEVAAKYIDYEQDFKTTTYLEGFLGKDLWDADKT